jgi:hypothetical protein
MTKQIVKLNTFYEVLSKEYDEITSIDNLINEYVVSIIKYKDKLVFNLVFEESIEVCLSKYPKRIYSGIYETIMDTKVLYLVDRGAVRYYNTLNIELRLVI